MQSLGLTDTYLSLVLPSAVSVFNILVLRAFFMGISPELTESARIDGAGDLRILLTIIMPLSRAVLAVISLFYAVGYWSSWFNASIYLSDQEMMPLQNVLIQLVQKHTEAPTGLQQAVRTGQLSSLGLQMAVMVLALIPVAIASPSSSGTSRRACSPAQSRAEAAPSGPPRHRPLPPALRGAPPMPDLSDATRGRLLFGGDYNPEQWPEETWHEDVRLMKAAGVNSVTLGVFSWSTLEPAPGAREFGRLDTLMDLMHENGIGVVLATPTSSPPPWLGRLHPDTLPVTEDGRTEWWGGRQHFSHSSATYRRYAAAITEDLAARYGGHPALTMWHINNEYCTFDYGDEAAAAFRRWLREKHGTLEALNETWGTAFWSQGYDTWDGILPPRLPHYMRNPTQVLDFRRFTSDMLLECYAAERDIVRSHTPHLPVTSNFMPLWVGQDAWRWAQEEDVVSVDIYPDPRDPLGAQSGALVQDMTRSQARGPWMLMEQAAGPVNWRGVNHPKPRGLGRLWSLQAVARGADAVCYFQWRQSRQGAEKFHSGMVSHAGEHGRTFQEVKQLGADLERIASGVSGRNVTADIAVLHDWNAWWAGAQDGRPSKLVDYPDILRAWHRALWQAHFTTDFAHPEHDLTPYAVVVVPQLYALTDAAIDNLLAHVRRGGTLVCGFQTGVADQDDRVRARRHGLPAARAVRHPHPARVVAAGRGGERHLRGLQGVPVVRGAGGRRHRRGDRGVQGR